MPLTEPPRKNGPGKTTLETKAQSALGKASKNRVASLQQTETLESFVAVVVRGRGA